MATSNDNIDLKTFSEKITNFPLKKFYYVIVFTLLILSLLGLSFQTDNANMNVWKVSAEIRVTSTTLFLLLIAWLPLLISWIVQLSPLLQQVLRGLQKGGVEQIAAGILSIKLSTGTKEVAEAYDNEVLNQPALRSASLNTTNINELESSYRETLDALNSSELLSPYEAHSRIDQLAKYYDLIRETLQSGRERTQLFSEIAAIMWALMPSTKGFPLEERLVSYKGGERLSAYKYIEWKPNLEHLDILLPRAVGVIETPFGQFNALLALLRVVVTIELLPNQKQVIREVLEWASNIDYIGDDRKNLMEVILASLD